jgi:hypothetical protein
MVLIDEEFKTIAESLQQDYPWLASDLRAFRLQIAEFMERLRRESGADDESEE